MFAMVLLVRVAAAVTPLVSSDGCEPAMVRELERVLEVEARGLAEPLTQLAVRCEGSQASITLQPEKNAATRTLSRGELPPNAWARLLALAAIELNEVRPAPPVVETPTVVLPKVEPVRASLPVVRAYATASVSGPMPLVRWGGSVGFAGRVGSNWGYFFSAAADSGGTESVLGRIDVTSISLAGRFGPAGATEQLGWETGLGARVGGVRIEGSPSSPNAVRGERIDAPWVAGLLGAVLSYRPWKQLRLEVALEGGWVFTPVVGTAESARAGISGPCASVGLGIGLGL